MCGPSDQMKNLNKNVQAFATNVSDEAKTIFGDASSIFGSLKTSLDKLVKGGPSQQGWSQGETNAVNSQIMENAAASARNVKAATGNAVAAIGGGNTPTVSGLETAVNTNAELGVEAEKNKQLSQATVQNYDTGRDNYFKAVSGEAQLPQIMNTANEANKTALDANKQAQQSQQSMDTASNWWQPLVMGAIGTATKFATGGMSNMGQGSGVGDFFKGGLGAVTSAGA